MIWRHKPAFVVAQFKSKDGLSMNTLQMKKNQTKRLTNARGFSLLELLVVLVILGILAAIVGPRVLKSLGGAKQDAAKVNIQSLGTLLDNYKLDTGRYPTTQEGLKALTEKPSGAKNWNGPYTKANNSPKDPWGNDYVYTAPGQHGDYDIVAYGSDGREGGDGEAKDVKSWEAE